ncbi:HIT domain-containing protein [Mesorhizobium sp.]|uniref:HIT domain-containing protein n=1 Tax=Mesorhizobium sp. TaxID=1871066 RepID=UPI00338EAA2D
MTLPRRGSLPYIWPMVLRSEKFRWITAGEYCARPAYDLPLRQTQSFVVLPSLGSLCVGWVLVVPRRPMPNLSHLNHEERSELRGLTVELSLQVSDKGKTPYQFEHGGHIGSAVNCGVEQAHLHIVPLEFDLVGLAKHQPDVNWRVVDDTLEAAGGFVGSEYLSVSDAKGRGAIGAPVTPQSQWFRRLIAAELHKGELWDYKQFPELPVLRQTAALFGGADGGYQ